MKWLLSKKMKFSKNQKGLTLVELLAVIVILGVIAAIAVPAIGSTITNSKTKADVQTELLIRAAAERYANDNNPLGNANGTPVSGATVTLTTLAAGYLQSIPIKATTNKTYKDVLLNYTDSAGWVASTVTTNN
jgi:type IV pilus assembly protein PilA